MSAPKTGPRVPCTQTARGSACGPAVPLGRGPESGRPLDPAARPWGRGRHLSRSGEGLEEGWAAWSRAVPRARTRAVCLAWIKLPAFPLCSRPLHEAWRVLLQVEEAGAVRLASRFRSFERDAVFSGLSLLVCRRDLAAFWGAVGPGGSLLSFHTAPGGTPLPGSSLWCASPWSHGHPPPAPPKLGRQQRALAWALTPPPRPPHPGAGAGAQAPSCARQFPSEAEGQSGTCLLLCAFVRQGERTSPGAARRVLCNSPAPAPHTPSQPDTLPV